MNRTNSNYPISQFALALSIAIVIPSAAAFAQNQPVNNAGGSSAPQTILPAFDKVLAAENGYFASIKDYKPGDLITQSEVLGALSAIKKAGWTPTNSDQIVGQFIDNNDPLAQAFSTPNGVKFMRKISNLPMGYDRVARMLLLPDGQKLVRDTINSVGGDELITYMTTSSGGRVLGQQIANAPKGVNFNAPSGNLYTQAQFMGVIQASYVAAVQAGTTVTGPFINAPTKKAK